MLFNPDSLALRQDIDRSSPSLTFRCIPKIPIHVIYLRFRLYLIYHHIRQTARVIETRDILPTIVVSTSFGIGINFAGIGIIALGGIYVAENAPVTSSTKRA